MSKKSGFAIALRVFIEANPRDPKSLGRAFEKWQDLAKYLETSGFITVSDKTQFVLSREVPDAPVADPASDEMPPLPAGLKRT